MAYSPATLPLLAAIVALNTASGPVVAGQPSSISVTPVAVTPVAVTPVAEAATAVEAPLMEPQAVRDEIRSAMRAEALAKNDIERLAAVERIVMMYHEVKRNTKIAKHERIRLHASVWSRLTRVKQRAEAKAAYAARNPQLVERRRKAEAQATLEQDPVSPPGSSLAQAGAATLGPAATLDPDGSRGGAASRDYGAELVDLITKTIAPDSWDVNGGPGSIVYYPNLQVLVVRQTGEGHRDMGGLIEGLRRAGP